MSWSHNSDWKKSVCKQNPLSSTLLANGFVESERTKEQKVEMLFFPLFIHFLVSLNLLGCLTQKQGWDSILGWLQDSVFFTWNGIQETHTPSRFSRNREAENMKSNSGQNLNSSKPNWWNTCSFISRTRWQSPKSFEGTQGWNWETVIQDAGCNTTKQPLLAKWQIANVVLFIRRGQQRTQGTSDGKCLFRLSSLQ